MNLGCLVGRLGHSIFLHQGCYKMVTFYQITKVMSIILWASFERPLGQVLRAKNIRIWSLGNLIVEDVSNTVYQQA